MNKKELIQNLVSKNYFLIISDLEKYLNSFLSENSSYSEIYQNIFEIETTFNSGYDNLSENDENKLIYLLKNTIELLPEKYFEFVRNYQRATDLEILNNSKSKDYYYEFITKYPEKEIISVIRQEFGLSENELIEINYWTDCCTINSLKTYYDYLNKYNTGIFRKQAKEKIDILKFDIRNKNIEIVSIQNQYWKHVSELDNKTAYENYLKYFPSGIYRHSAEQKIKNSPVKFNTEIQPEKKKKRTLKKTLKIAAACLISAFLIYSGIISFYFLKAENSKTNKNFSEAVDNYKTANYLTFGILFENDINSTNDLYLVQWWNTLGNDLKHKLFPEKYYLVKNISDIKNIIALDTANLEGISTTDFKFLKPLINLKTLNLSNTEISDLSPLSEMKNLEILDISKTNVKDLTPLKELTKIISLNCNYLTDLQSLWVLKNMENLEKLYIHDADLKSIKTISKIESLVDLNISNNNISDIEGINNLQKLRYLSIENNPITYVEELKSLPNLTQLRICNISVSEPEILKFVENYNLIYSKNLTIKTCESIVMENL